MVKVVPLPGAESEESEKSTVTLAANLAGMKAAGSIVFGSSAILGRAGFSLAGAGSESCARNAVTESHSNAQAQPNR